MNSNVAVLEENLKKFIDIPFFLQPQKDQKEILNNFEIIFKKIKNKLEKSKTLDTKVGKYIEEIIQIIKSEPFNEGDFSYLLNKLLFEIDPTSDDREYNSLKLENDKLMLRAQPFWSSEAVVTTSREKLLPEEIKNHDFLVLRDEAQIYGLDYFLMMYKLLDTNKDLTERKKLVYIGHEDLPALISDALSDDMLVKIIYHLIDKDLRNKMILSYYDYKKIFLSINKDETLATENEMEKVYLGLKEYIKSLIKVSLENGIDTIQNVVYSPYGQTVNLTELNNLFQ